MHMTLTLARPGDQRFFIASWGRATWMPARARAAAELGRQVDEFCRHDESASGDENPRKGAVMAGPETHTLDAPGAVLHYDVRSTDRYSHTAGI